MLFLYSDFNDDMCGIVSLACVLGKKAFINSGLIIKNLPNCKKVMHNKMKMVIFVLSN